MSISNCRTKILTPEEAEKFLLDMGEKPEVAKAIAFGKAKKRGIPFADVLRRAGLEDLALKFETSSISPECEIKKD